ncbi:MAG: transcriptional regulator NrdR [Ruminococcaceae bacterium]|nr:transcriptional regulator NrdR [Oscillospiraceae bacterium]
MKCPVCQCLESKVLDSRPADEGSTIRRRRECLECKKRFTTYERIETIPMMVVKKDNSRQPFDRNKLVGGIRRACEKRPVSADVIERAVDEIESALTATLNSEVSSEYIGELVMDKLKGIDQVAYVRFASVYRQFKDIDTFMEEVKLLMKDKK